MKGGRADESEENWRARKESGPERRTAEAIGDRISLDRTGDEGGDEIWRD